MQFILFRIEVSKYSLGVANALLKPSPSERFFKTVAKLKVLKRM
ncbi:uncharacterized protein Dmoj_GI26197 [Drosophila mojavensis]|uniref:Uncharacterized protein n=1 Tax=Drosophila mojavensis TaxID=7230 RepID=A0A0Q9XAG0_DROMO|nr:uncharacterized protein Dmoj_GI26197 [Drosophila mojavensis]